MGFCYTVKGNFCTFFEPGNGVPGTARWNGRNLARRSTVPWGCRYAPRSPVSAIKGAERPVRHGKNGGAQPADTVCLRRADCIPRTWNGAVFHRHTGIRVRHTRTSAVIRSRRADRSRCRSVSHRTIPTGGGGLLPRVVYTAPWTQKQRGDSAPFCRAVFRLFRCYGTIHIHTG